MVTQRIAFAIVLIVGLMAPIGAGTSSAAHASTSPVLWHIDNHRFDPSQRSEIITDTFMPRADYAVVTVSLSSSDSHDYISVQLGDFPFNTMIVQSGEQRVFVASHLQPQVMPVLRVLADPARGYGGRILTYAVHVLPVLATSRDAQGIAISRTPNYVVFQVPRSATYAVQYALSTGSATIEVLSATVTKDSSSLTRNGAFTVDLRPGLVQLKLTQVPARAPMVWRLGLTMAPRTDQAKAAKKD
jgi:hypothetical protein